jgi:predicted esterase
MKSQSQSSSKRLLKWIIIVLTIVILGFLFTGIRWATYARPPLPEALAGLESDELVEVTTEPWLIFEPVQVTPQTGFIFYPGGRVDPRGYAHLMKAIASEGYLAVVPEMPINMAPFNPNVADEIIANFPDITQWVIGGHSVGGTMAAQYTDQNRESIDGLAIWASYPADSTDLSDSSLPTILIYGDLDPGVNDESVAERKHLLPSDTQYIRIEGGDHHQFGSYVIKPEEHHATIDRAAQQRQILEGTLILLEDVSETN